MGTGRTVADQGVEATMRKDVDEQSMLERLEDTSLELADPAEDARGRVVIDSDGDDAGTVSGLFVDRAERRVRMLEVKTGGFLGIWASTQLVPVDAVTAVDADMVHIGARREQVAKGPAYDPHLTRREPRYFTELYGYYGYAPFWAPGYTIPRYPFP